MNITDKPPEYAALLSLHPEYDRREKLYRMCSGCSSAPVGYKDGIVEIEIRLSDSTIKDETKTDNVINGLMKNWMHAVPDAKSYKAHIYRTGLAEAGFMTTTSKLKGEDRKPDKAAISELASAIHHMMTAERIDVKIDEREWPGIPTTE